MIEIKYPTIHKTKATNFLGIYCIDGKSQIAVDIASVMPKALSIPKQNSVNPSKIAQKF